MSSRDDLTHHVVVHALSPDGIIIESQDLLPAGTRVTFEIADIGERSATIMSRDGLFYDCVFERRLDPRNVHQILLSTKVVWGEFGAGSAKAAPLQDPVFVMSEAISAEADMERWSPRARAWLLIGLGILCWVPPIGLFLGWSLWIAG